MATSGLVGFGILYGCIMPIVVRRTKEVEHADMMASAITGEVLGSVRSIVANGTERRAAKKYSAWVEESRRRGLKISMYVGIQYAPSESMSNSRRSLTNLRALFSGIYA